MTNVETRMTKEARSTNVEGTASRFAERADVVPPSSFSLVRLLAADRHLHGWGGSEAGGLRAYVPGDDYRHVDWRCCARRGALFTRTYEAAADVPRYFLLDCSASMGLGRPSKFDAARGLAAALGCAALAAGDAIDISPCCGRAAPEGLRLRGKNQVLRLRRWLDTLALDPSPAELGRSAAALALRRQQPGPVVILSDFMDRDGFQRPLALLRHYGYSPRIVQIYAPEEADPHAMGDVELRDVESPAGVRATLSPRIVARYRKLFAEFLASVRQYTACRGWYCVQWASDQSLRVVSAASLAPARIGGGPPQ
jgi:uncharacterized protein (DUF58 family)